MARAGLTVERLTVAAAELADEAGFEGITLSALARRFGVKDASLYSHVKNLRELRQRVALYTAGEFIDSIAAAVAGRAGKDALVAFADAYRAYALAHPGRYAATQFRVDPELLVGSTVMARTADTTYGMLRAYGLTEPDLTDAVRLLRSTFHGYVSLEAEGGFGHPREVRRSWERGVEALHIALEHWPRSEEKNDD
ncbi:TetR/AcrR family transcriptional regulator [Streptomyces sp. SDr-06]|uniref:TetR/AcrR family transcriptional regulator n=1 Tax=Streptomyces sp. SDr-06 TaxID=2267702 RepID=UPI000DE9BA25|nr:TetR-like C-terminal domain-containing protein [Streptomyces sp. SDr-06]RCH66996.1 TetR family transcriptional regulator [Streptomyces sp. SDr-06]